MTETAPRFDGERLKLGDREFVVPPLNWRRIRKLIPVFNRMEQAKAASQSAPGVDAAPGFSMPGMGKITDAMLTDFITVIYEAVSRNYPEITQDELEDLVDLVNAPKVYMSIMGLSGLLQGEPMPVEEKTLIGESSTLA
jgi:hypothetical protein